jgi:hypothetical protein
MQRPTRRQHDVNQYDANSTPLRRQQHVNFSRQQDVNTTPTRRQHGVKHGVKSDVNARLLCLFSIYRCSHKYPFHYLRLSANSIPFSFANLVLLYFIVERQFIYSIRLPKFCSISKLIRGGKTRKLASHLGLAILSGLNIVFS